MSAAQGPLDRTYSGVDTVAGRRGAFTWGECLAVRRGSQGVWLATNQEIKELNRDYRGKDKATDVLSFPLFKVRFLREGPTKSPEPHQALARRLPGVRIEAEYTRPVPPSTRLSARLARTSGPASVSLDRARTLYLYLMCPHGVCVHRHQGRRRLRRIWFHPTGIHASV